MNQRKQATLYCNLCGKLYLDDDLFISDNKIILPTNLYERYVNIGQFYSKYYGSTFKKDTGRRIKDSFIKKIVTDLSHFNTIPDELRTHTLLPFEAWVYEKNEKTNP